MNKTTQNRELQITQFEDRGLIGLSGGDARNFLQNLVSNDVNLVSNNHAIYSLLLTPQGKFLYDFILYYTILYALKHRTKLEQYSLLLA